MDLSFRSAGLLAAVIVLIAGAGAALTILVGRRRKSLWKRFARRHRLHFVEDAADPHVVGTIAGRPFELTVEGKSSDNELGVREISMSLGLHTHAGATFSAERAAPLIAPMERSADSHAVQTGDDEFDREVLLVGESAERCLEWLTPARRSILQQVVEECGEATVNVEGGWLSLEDRDVIPQLDVLERWLAILREAADRFDAAG